VRTDTRSSAATSLRERNWDGGNKAVPRSLGFLTPRRYADHPKLPTPTRWILRARPTSRGLPHPTSPPVEPCRLPAPAGPTPLSPSLMQPAAGWSTPATWAAAAVTSAKVSRWILSRSCSCNLQNSVVSLEGFLGGQLCEVAKLVDCKSVLINFAILQLDRPATNPAMPDREKRLSFRAHSTPTRPKAKNVTKNFRK
jgi:hypothetical protein